MRDSKSGRISRREATGFLDKSDNSKKPICTKCEKEGYDSRANMVPYIMEDGRPDPGFLRCSTCALVYPIHELKYESDLEDMIDVETANKPAQFIGVNSGRSSRKYNRSGPMIDQQEIPELAGKPDTDLENMVRDGAIIVSIEDENIEEE